MINQNIMKNVINNVELRVQFTFLHAKHQTKYVYNFFLSFIPFTHGCTVYIQCKEKQNVQDASHESAHPIVRYMNSIIQNYLHSRRKIESGSAIYQKASNLAEIIIKYTEVNNLSGNIL